MNEEALADPEAHHSKLKAKIRLKVAKDYHEDIKRKEEEERKAREPVLEVKDEWGRVMEKKKLYTTNKKRVPNANRFPKKKPPLKVRKSFAAEQKKYNDADNMYDPMAD